MQHTNKYQFNLIESEDTFSANPLNENMEKVEAALETQAAAIGTGGQTCRIAYGSYVGDGTGPKTLTFDFTPYMLTLYGRENSTSALGTTVVYGVTGALNAMGDSLPSAVWEGNSITFGTKSNNDYNDSGRTIYYVALGY